MKDTEKKAFPFVSEYKSDGGMNLRDYFAVEAMQAIMQNPSKSDFQGLNGKEVIKTVCEISYEYADAMMEVRKK